MPQLNDWRRELFCWETVQNPGKSAGHCAAAAGFGNKDCAATQASKLLDEPEIVERIEELKKRKLFQIEADSGSLLELVRRRAYATPTDYYRQVVYREGKRMPLGTELEDGDETDSELIPPHELTNAQAKGIIGIKIDRRGVMTYQHASMEASALLMRHGGLLNDKVDVTSGGQSLNLSDSQIAERAAQILNAVRERTDKPS